MAPPTAAAAIMRIVLEDDDDDVLIVLSVGVVRPGWLENFRRRRRKKGLKEWCRAEKEN